MIRFAVTLNSATPGHPNVYDNYANDGTYEKMAADQEFKLEKYSGWGNGYLFLLSWTLTGGGVVSDIEVLAGMANPWLPKKLFEIPGTRTPNIVYLDFIDPYLCRAIVESNYVGSAYVVNSLGRVFFLSRPDVSWKSLGVAISDENFAQEIGVGSNGSVWVIGTEARPGGFAPCYLGADGNWVKVQEPAAATKIAVAPNGMAGVVNSLGTVYLLSRPDASGNSSSVAISEEGFAQEIGIGSNGSVWVIGTEARPGGFAPCYLGADGKWVTLPAPAAATKIAVAPDGSARVVNSGGTVWALSKLDASGHYSSTKLSDPNSAQEIGVASDGSVWLIGNSNETRPGGFALHYLAKGTGQMWITIQPPAAATKIAGR